MRPKRREKSRRALASRRCPGKRRTPWRPRAWRMVAKSRSERGSARSMPRTVAPRISPVGSITAMPALLSDAAIIARDGRSARRDRRDLAEAREYLLREQLDALLGLGVGQVARAPDHDE